MQRMTSFASAFRARSTRVAWPLAAAMRASTRLVPRSRSVRPLLFDVMGSWRASICLIELQARSVNRNCACRALKLSPVPHHGSVASSLHGMFIPTASGAESNASSLGECIGETADSDASNAVKSDQKHMYAAPFQGRREGEGGKDGGCCEGQSFIQIQRSSCAHPLSQRLCPGYGRLRHDHGGEPTIRDGDPARARLHRANSHQGRPGFLHSSGIRADKRSRIRVRQYHGRNFPA